MFSRQRGFPRRRWSLPALLAACACAALLASCGSSASPSSDGKALESYYTPVSAEGTPVKGGTLRFSRSIEPVSLDPVDIGDNGSSWVAYQVYDQLVEFLPGKTEPQPGLATRWDISPDGLTYTFTLREGVRFSDGTPVTSEDVRYSLQRLIDLETAAGFMIQNFKRITAPDAGTVVIELRRPTTALIQYLAISQAAIVPKHVVEKIGLREFATHPVGSGAFTVEEFNRGKNVTLRANPHYWRKGQPYLDGVEFTLTPDASTRVLAVQSGGADVADSVPFAQIDALRNDPKADLLIRPLYSMATVLINHTSGELRDAKVRRALALATPREAIVKTVFAGAAEPATGILPKTEFWDRAVKGWPYDPAAAKRLIEESGGGFRVTMLTQAGDPDVKALAAVLQQSWKEIGVTLDIRQTDSSTQVTRWLKGDYDMQMFNVEAFSSDVPAEDELATFIQDYASGSKAAFTFYDSKEATRLVNEASESTSESERRRLFGELQQLGVDDAQLDSIAYIPSRTLLSKQVRGFDPMPTGPWRLDQVWLAK